MKTSTPAQAPLWVLIDAQGQSLGRVAAKVAMVLRGKHRPTFSPQSLCGDHVIIINAAALSIPPGKFRRKEYVRHTGYPGNLRRTPLRAAFEKKPAWVMEHAVRGMLPANRLRPRLLQRLHVFPGSEHPHAAQKPSPLPLRKGGGAGGEGASSGSMSLSPVPSPAAAGEGSDGATT